jgi:class 3 adenylate cyclase
MFLDVVGFSKFSQEKISDTLDFLRSIANPIVRDAGGCNLNMWGDAIVATFEDPITSVKTAIRIMKFLAVDGLDARIGMSWGPVRTKHNPALGRTDIDGETVNEAARIEPLADIGEILTTEEFRHLCGSEADFEFVPKRVELKKPFSDKGAGEELNVLKVRTLLNH